VGVITFEQDIFYFFTKVGHKFLML